MDEGLLPTCREVTKATVRHNLHSIHTSETDKVLLTQVWVNFILNDGRLDFAVMKDIIELSYTDITHADVSYEALANELFHRFPSLLVSDTHVLNHTRNQSVLIV